MEHQNWSLLTQWSTHNFQIQLQAPQINSLLKLITTMEDMLFKVSLKRMHVTPP